MASEENPVEEFRRVTAATMRAISEREDIQLTFGSEARLVGNNETGSFGHSVGHHTHERSTFDVSRREQECRETLGR